MIVAGRLPDRLSRVDHGRTHHATTGEDRMYVSPARIAHMYYEQGLTQQQIANETSLSRIRVSRILQQARVDGTVTITIDYGSTPPSSRGSPRSTRAPGSSSATRSTGPRTR
jgi:hypothetical protein